MAIIARLKVWIKEVLDFVDLNNEFDNIVDELNARDSAVTVIETSGTVNLAGTVFAQSSRTHTLAFSGVEADDFVTASPVVALSVVSLSVNVDPASPDEVVLTYINNHPTTDYTVPSHTVWVRAIKGA